MREPHEQQQIDTLSAAFVKDMAQRGITVRRVSARELPISSADRVHIEFVFEGHCDEPTYARIEEQDEDTYGELTMVNSKPRHDAEGKFDPTLGFRWTLHGAINR